MALLLESFCPISVFKTEILMINMIVDRLGWMTGTGGAISIKVLLQEIIFNK